MLPEDKIPFPLPIETFLKNFESNERKIERRNAKRNDFDINDARQQFETAAKQ